MLWPTICSRPLRLRPRDRSFLAVVTAGKSRAARLRLANAGRGSARPARLRVTVRAQLGAVPAGGAWPDLHGTLRPCDVSRAFLYKAGERRNSCSAFRPSFCAPVSRAGYPCAPSPTMSTGVYLFPMEVAVYQLHNFSISFFSSLLGGDVVSVKLDNSASGASVVAIDNKIEQAMDLVKNHLMYAVREEVEVLKEQIKELAEKNCRLERENSLLKNLASPEQLQKFHSHLLLEAPMAEKKSQGAAAPAQHRAGSAV